jgi:hypothetical protein
MAQGKKLTDKVISNGIEYAITTKHPIYQLRYRIMTRCYNASAIDYPYYQGKGIKMCDEWKNDYISFFKWCLDNGWKDGLVMDRIDSNKNYEPSNCRFVTIEENISKMHKDNGMYGEKSANAKLTEDQVREIRKLIAADVKLTRIAKDFRVAPTTIGAIKRKQNWKDLI